MFDINAIFAELAQYNRLLEETERIIDGLKDTIKAYMVENNLDTLSGDEHKATYRPVTSSRVDTTALKKELPEVVARYLKTSTTNRFTFS